MEEERSKLGKSSWIMLGAAVAAFGIFIVIFMQLQGSHEDDVARCVEKCNSMPECRFADGQAGNPCHELCGIAPAKTMTCMDTVKTCESLGTCVVENP